MEGKIPHTKQEAFARLDEVLSEKDKCDLQTGDATDFHFSLGLWIRNNWIHGQDDEDVDCLARAFRTGLFFDPDTLSEKIIKSYQTYLKRKTL